jgi:APA family basic amino acid/polyamine antiporter
MRRAGRLAQSDATTMRLAPGDTGATSLHSALRFPHGFLSQGMLTAPRVYFAMAEDGVFFRKFAEVSAATRVPIPAIVLQGAAAIVIACRVPTGRS